MATKIDDHLILVDGEDARTESEEEYEDEVVRLVNLIVASRSGGAIAHKISSSGVTRIVPYSEKSEKKFGHCNAVAKSDMKYFKGWKGVLANPMIKTATVEFTPKLWKESSSCRWNSGPGFTPDEVLMHELVHSARQLGADSAHVPLSGALAVYDNEEEFFAVLVANIYASETGRQVQGAAGLVNSNLVADHRTPASHIPFPMTISEVFLYIPEHYRLIEKFCGQHTVIAPMIGQAAGAFNPIRAYLNQKKK